MSCIAAVCAGVKTATGSPADAVPPAVSAGFVVLSLTPAGGAVGAACSGTRRLTRGLGIGAGLLFVFAAGEVLPLLSVRPIRYANPSAPPPITTTANVAMAIHTPLPEPFA